MASSSSTQNNTHHQLLLPPSYTATPAPPPTPSNHHNLLLPSSSDNEALSRLLHNHLRPTTLLSLPNHFRPKTKTTTNSPPPSLPVISLQSNLSQSLSAASLPSSFQLTHHPIPSHLPISAELQSLSLFQPNSTHNQSQLDTWPLGFDEDDDGNQRSFCFDPAASSSSSSFFPSLSSLKELAQALEKVGLDVVEALSCAVGFDNPLQENGRACSLMWVSPLSSTDGSAEEDDGLNGEVGLDPGRVYPYVVALQYQIQRRKYSLLADSGWVCVEPDVDSLLVTIGDIAQVWSNGKLKKVRGRPVASSRKEEGGGSSCVSMCLLVTLSMDSIISPLIPLIITKTEDGEGKDTDDDGDGDNRINNFSAFSFEEYAWRVYHERFHFKDPLERYRL